MSVESAWSLFDREPNPSLAETPMSSTTSATIRPRLIDALLLGLGLLLLLAMLLRYVDAPLLDRHSWRQVDTASFARGMARGDFDLLHPRFLAHYPDAYGIGGAAETEFNLYPLIVAGGMRLLGESDAIGRVVSIAFSLGTAAWTYLLGRRYFGERAAALAVVALSLSPLFVFYGRAVQPEATVLFFSLGSFYLFTQWLERGRWPLYAGALACTALAFLTKIPSLYMGLPLLAAAWLKYRRQLLRRWELWAFALLALGPAALYYAQAHQLYRETGLTVYGIGGGWPGSGKFDTLGQLLSTDFYRVMFARLRGLILGRPSWLLFLLGLLIAPRRRDEWVLYAWVAAVGLFVLAVAQGNRQHEYYQLPLVPVAALFVGKAAAALCDPSLIRLRWVVLPRSMASLLLLILLGFGLSQSLQNLQPMYAQSSVLLEVAEATRRLCPEGQPVAILHDWARVPEVFYYADRRGWSLWLERTPEGEYGRLIVAAREKTSSGWRVEENLEAGVARMDLLRAQGAVRLVVSLEKGTSEQFLRSNVGRQLGDHYWLLERGDHWLIYDLARPVAYGGEATVSPGPFAESNEEGTSDA